MSSAAPSLGGGRPVVLRVLLRPVRQGPQPASRPPVSAAHLPSQLHISAPGPVLTRVLAHPAGPSKLPLPQPWAGLTSGGRCPGRGPPVSTEVRAPERQFSVLDPRPQPARQSCSHEIGLSGRLEPRAPRLGRTHATFGPRPQ